MVASTIYFYLPKLLEAINPPSGKYIGMIVKAEGDLRMRFGSSMNWRNVKVQDKIYSQTYLFTGSNSSAIYGFTDESSITLGENSLIYMETLGPRKSKKASAEADGPVTKGVKLELIEGDVQLNLKEDSNLEQIKVEENEIDLTKSQKMVVKMNYEKKDGLEVAVLEGDIQVKNKKGTIPLKSGEKLDAPTEEEATTQSLDAKTMEKIKLEAERDQQRVVEDLKKKRQLGYILHAFIEIIQGK